MSTNIVNTPTSRGQGTGRRWRRPLQVAVSTLLVAAACWFLWRTARAAGWQALRDRVASVDPALLAAVVGVNLARYALWALRWQIVSRPVIRFPLWPAAKALMASLFITTVIPGSRAFGGLIRARHLGRETGQPAATLYGAAAIDQFGYGVVSMAMGALFLPVVFWGDPSGKAGNRLWLFVGIGAMVLAFAVAWWRRAALLERLRRRTPGLAGKIEEVVTAARALLVRPGSWGWMLSGGVIVYSANIVTLQIAAAALGWEMSFAEAAGAFSVGSLAGTVVNTPGGVGPTEAAATLFLERGVGIPPDVALAAVFLARSVHYLASLVLGGLAAWAGPRETRDRPSRT